MHRSRTSLQKWFIAMHLFCTSKHGIVAKELECQLDVTYKTAWRMADEISKWMAVVDGENPLDGDVEIDETMIGGAGQANVDAVQKAKRLCSVCWYGMGK